MKTASSRRVPGQNPTFAASWINQSIPLAQLVGGASPIRPGSRLSSPNQAITHAMRTRHTRVRANESIAGKQCINAQRRVVKAERPSPSVASPSGARPRLAVRPYARRPVDPIPSHALCCHRDLSLLWWGRGYFRLAQLPFGGGQEGASPVRAPSMMATSRGGVHLHLFTRDFGNLVSSGTFWSLNTLLD